MLGRSVALTSSVFGGLMRGFLPAIGECAGMKRRVLVFVSAFALGLCLGGSRTSNAQEQPTALPDAPSAQPGIIVGTVIDVNNDAVPGPPVVLEGPLLKSPRTVVSNNNGFFEFSELEPATPYHVTI